MKVDKVDKKSKLTQKLKHTNSILGHFEYFCQMSSKSILIISSYAVSKFTRFFETHYVIAYDVHFVRGVGWALHAVSVS